MAMRSKLKTVLVIMLTVVVMLSSSMPSVAAQESSRVDRPIMDYIKVPAPDVKEVKQSLVEGLTNVWYEYVPKSYTGDKAVPLVISLHGGGENGKHQSCVSTWHIVADRENFIVVYPNASANNSWNIEKNDAEYLKKLIEVIRSKYNIDKTRVYMCGFSMGDMMTFAFARKYGDMLAAAACFSGPTAPQAIKEATPVTSVPMFQIRGEEDTLASGVTPDPNDRYAARAMLNDYNREYWLEGNKTSFNPVISIHDYENYVIYKSGWGDVVYSEIKGMSHQELIYAAEIVWNKFFSRYSRVNGKIVEGAPKEKLEGDKNAVALAVDSTRALINNKVVNIDDANPKASSFLVYPALPEWAKHLPFVIKPSEMFGALGFETLYVPVKFLEKAFGAKVELSNGGKTAKITTADSKVYELNDQSPAAFTGNRVIGLHKPAIFIDGTLMVPVRNTAEILFNKNVSYCNGVVYISDHKAQLTRGTARIIKGLLDKGSDQVISEITCNSYVADLGQKATSFEIKVNDANILKGLTKDDFIISNAVLDHGYGTGYRNIGVKSMEIAGNVIKLNIDEFLLFKSDGGGKLYPLYVSCKNPALNFEYKDIKIKTELVDEFTSEVYNGLKYRLYTPKTTQKVPLVLYLHGGGNTGVQLVASRGAVFWATQEVQSKYPCYVMAPQSDDSLTTKKWSDREINNCKAVINTLINAGKVNANKVYIIGHSMGSRGVFDAIIKDPNYFAAAISLSTRGPAGFATPDGVVPELPTEQDLALLEKLNNFPIWLIHATNDPISNVQGSLLTYKKLISIGNTKVKMSELSDSEMKRLVPSIVSILEMHATDAAVGHMEGVVDWLFSQTR